MLARLMQLDPDESDDEPPTKRAKRPNDAKEQSLAFWDHHFASLFGRSLHYLHSDTL